MKVTVRITKNFKKEAKKLFKKFNSLPKDLEQLEKDLIESPRIGTPLGHGCYKIRLKISSKGKGKSGGARVITYCITEDNELYLLSIYDKGKQADISVKVIRSLIDKILNLEK